MAFQAPWQECPTHSYPKIERPTIKTPTDGNVLPLQPFTYFAPKHLRSFQSLRSSIGHGKARKYKVINLKQTCARVLFWFSILLTHHLHKILQRLCQRRIHRFHGIHWIKKCQRNHLPCTEWQCTAKFQYNKSWCLKLKHRISSYIFCILLSFSCQRLDLSENQHFFHDFLVQLCNDIDRSFWDGTNAWAEKHHWPSNMLLYDGGSPNTSFQNILCQHTNSISPYSNHSRISSRCFLNMHICPGVHSVDMCKNIKHPNNAIKRTETSWFCEDPADNSMVCGFDDFCWVFCSA